MDPLVEALLSRISEMRDRYKNHLASGSVPDYSTFQNIRGVVQGLDVVDREIRELVSKFYGEESEQDLS